jgi:hypothetical protein
MIVLLRDFGPYGIIFMVRVTIRVAMVVLVKDFVSYEIIIHDYVCFL